MAHFRGVIEGNRGSESRLGGKDSGLLTVAQSWAGQIAVQLYEKDGVDYARITAERNPAVYGGSDARRVIAEGPIKELRETPCRCG